MSFRRCAYRVGKYAGGALSAAKGQGKKDEEMDPMIFDSHAHYDDAGFDNDREELLGSMRAHGVGTIINVCADWKSVTAVPDLASRYPFIYAAVGIHPDETGCLNEERFQCIRSVCMDKKVVAVGETGLDYYREGKDKDTQKHWFIRQLELAGEMGLPVIIHSRDAAADTLGIVKEHAAGLKGVLHCFSYPTEMALEYVRMGFMIGVGGVVTFKNARNIKEVVSEVPLDKILLETDCPYLAPEPHRGERNSSLYLKYVAEKIAEIKGIPAGDVIAQTEKNARKLFSLPEQA